jgi:RNA polymerase sigma factor (sigma-70 family)
MNDYSDEDLLFMISLKNESGKEAEEAFRIFYNRHKQFLWNLCYKVCRNEDLAKDVMQNTWIAIHKYCHTYDAQRSKVTTWMSKIARNEMCDLFKSETKNIPLNEDIYSISDDNAEDTEFTTPEKKILEEALNTLSERDKDILRTYMQYSEGNKHLPDEITNELCRRYSTTSANLRQIKKRSLEKVKNYMTSNKAITINKNK